MSSMLKLINNMEKTVTIEGRLNEKGSVANTLAILAAKEGMSLTRYITLVLTNHAKNSKL
jgi:predicted HicB family RNase H-like nuclease